MLHEVYLEKLQHDTGGHEEAIKNVRYCMVLRHFVLSWAAETQVTFQLFNLPLSHLSKHYTSI